MATHSITSSAIADTPAGTSRPSALAVLRLITNSNLVESMTGRSSGLSPHPISAPSSHERGKHYLQRFWEKLPEHGQIVVFDRSRYGRVLVERVEGFATKRQWRRGYEEINQFERLLVEDGIRIAKIFLHISAGEQIRRFKDRVNNPLKRWNLSYEDFRNRERWADYEIAIEDMIEKTSTKRAPWYLGTLCRRTTSCSDGSRHSKSLLIGWERE
jgi:polyphosphate kinase 2 (PPK2 family)